MFVINILVYFVTSYLHYEIQGVPINKGSTGDIVFPEPDDALPTPVPRCSRNRTFCEDVDVYPEDEFFAVLRNSSYEREYFGSQDDVFSGRFHPDRESHICGSRAAAHLPRAARNAKGRWRFVYNFDRYKQQITTEECEGETSCTRLQDFPKGVRTKCVQKYSDSLLLVADDDGRPVWDVFWFPSACICSYEHIVSTNFA